MAKKVKEGRVVRDCHGQPNLCLDFLGLELGNDSRKREKEGLFDEEGKGKNNGLFF